MRSFFAAYRSGEIIASLCFFIFSVWAIVSQQWLWMLVPFAILLVPVMIQAAIQHTKIILASDDNASFINGIEYYAPARD